jgi:carboxymethylenebutenolidase
MNIEQTAGSGFAAAVLPISATAIETDETGILAGDVTIPTGDVRIPAYRAAPNEGESFPVVLVVQEIFGLHEHIKDLCRRLAKHGYLAIAPSLYTRQGDVLSMADTQQIFTEVVSKVPDAQVMSDLDYTVRWATGERGDISRLVAAGFCWGGRAVWLYAAHSDQLKAGAAWYGRIAGNKTPLTPKNPIDVAGELKAPVIGFYGGRDQHITLDTVEKMRAAIRPPSEIFVYEDAAHGFNADYRPGYHAEAAQDAWKKMLAFFGKQMTSRDGDSSR